MKNKKIIFVILLISLMNFNGCTKANNEQQKIDKTEDVLPKYSDVVVMEAKDKDELVYSIKEDGHIEEIGKLNSISDLQYSLSSGIVAYVKIISYGKNLSKNIISILNKEQISIKDFYSALNVKLSKDGSKIAFRVFSEDSLASAKGTKIYNTSNGSKLKFDEDVIISGDLYNWINGNEILYYGVTAGQRGFGKLYKYNFSSDKKDIIFDGFKGYCTYFLPISESSFIGIESYGDNCEFNYYDVLNNKKLTLSNSIDEIFAGAIDKNSKKIYFIGREHNSLVSALYEISLVDYSMKRITYDFPRNIDKNGDIALSTSGKVYFIGDNSDNGKSDIYMYDYLNNSTNLISEKSGFYKIFSDIK